MNMCFLNKHKQTALAGCFLVILKLFWLIITTMLCWRFKDLVMPWLHTHIYLLPINAVALVSVAAIEIALILQIYYGFMLLFGLFTKDDVPLKSTLKCIALNGITEFVAFVYLSVYYGLVVGFKNYSNSHILGILAGALTQLATIYILLMIKRYYQVIFAIKNIGDISNNKLYEEKVKSEFKIII